MSRTVDAITQSLVAKLPVGWAFGKRGGVLDALLGAVASAIADAEQSAEALTEEIDPRNASNLLTDYERVLGPDPCGRDLDELLVQQRQQIAYQRWTGRGGQSVPYMIDTAAKVGTSIEVVEFWPTRCGAFRAGDRLIADGEQFAWMVRLEIDGEVQLFRTGVSRAGDRLGTFTLSLAECELRRIRPAHTDVVFSYVDYLYFDGDPLLVDGDPLCVGA